ncbi:nucleoside hydrolase-like domain-containing protein [Arenibacter sp. F20364]|uniref:nucleoside hydrolase-like domain-containing protein n=1 Tax=Arenibacter sp. F20364 TaxID=2926415 RepID=UPI001FF27E63|nr:nucleoside hydrolase-like domain-containing protein [Arenibacter sp. F20364]MCK0190296.1 DUF1593 domain-containing protein [Arenibacter sp. F20364]
MILIRTLLVLFTFSLGMAYSHTTHGYDLWMGYTIKTDAEILSNYSALAKSVYFPQNSEVLKAAQQELEKGFKDMLNIPVNFNKTLDPTNSLIVSKKDVLDPNILSLLSEKVGQQGNEGFVIESIRLKGKKVLVVAANTDVGILYGVFRLLRLLQTQENLNDIKISDSPKISLGMLNHWDNLDRTVALAQCQSSENQIPKPRILISSDIGGTDPDDFQSIIHLLMYADLFQIEGLVSSPYGEGRKKDILDMIDLYERDLPDLKRHAPTLPRPDSLRNLCKQGALAAATYKGYDQATEGSDWIIKCAKKDADGPLWVLVWGGLEDLAQALHDAPEIEKNIKIYWIGGPNKKWSINAYAYIAKNHPNLWIIEANATYRGWFMDSESSKELKGDNYYDNFIQGRGAMGKNFKNHYKGEIKMGDTPSLAYVMNGDPNNPLGESWGGSFIPIDRSSRTIFTGNSSTMDTVAAYGELEWRFTGPDLDIPRDSTCFTMEISSQIWPGYYLGDGTYAVRYSSKKPETGSYVTKSAIPELDAQKGQYVSITPWPGKTNSTDYPVGPHWYSDKLEPELFLGDQQGAKTVSKHRKAFLRDWAKRWQWLNK